MKILKKIAIAINRFNSWFDKNFEWVFTNGRKILNNKK